MIKSNVEIKSEGPRHHVFVGGVKMLGVVSASIEYKAAEMATATIKISLPASELKGLNNV
jgi:hypothetical protein